MARRTSPDLSEAGVLRLAQGYLSRRAASTAQLRRVLLRKVAGRLAEAGEAAPEPTAVSETVEIVLRRVVQSGLIDDPTLARARADTLMRKGLSGREVKRRLRQQGLDFNEAALADVLSVSDDDQARRFAERQRLGPLASGRRPASPDRDMRAMVRAGFSPAVARRVLRTLGPDDQPSPQRKAEQDG